MSRSQTARPRRHRRARGGAGAGTAAAAGSAGAGWRTDSGINRARARTGGRERPSNAHTTLQRARTVDPAPPPQGPGRVRPDTSPTEPLELRLGGDHPPPHVHARYGGHKGRIAIATGELIDGDLPPRALRFIKDWCELRREEVHANWQRAVAELPLTPIAIRTSSVRRRSIPGPARSLGPVVLIQIPTFSTTPDSRQPANAAP